MPQPWQTILIVLAFLAVDVVVIGAIVTAVTKSIRDLATRHPPRPPAADAVIRRGQSISVGAANYGGCVTIAADGAFLHLRPNGLASFFGMRDMSIPWASVQVRDIGKRRGKANVGTTTLVGPAWALSVAKQLNAPGAADGASSTSRL